MVDATADQKFISVSDAEPPDAGGTIARKGFSYQDEVAVGFFIDMLSDSSLINIHCETHDDIVLVRDNGDGTRAEYIQVKGGAIDKLWTVPDLCRRETSKLGSSLFEKSLLRDAHSQASYFRLVTLRSVVNAVKPLTYPLGTPGRELGHDDMKKLKKDIDSRCPDAVSKKGNNSEFWLKRCLWDVRHGLKQIANANHIAMLKLARDEGRPLVVDQAQVLLDALRAWAKVAGEADWKSERDKKIITRYALRTWWEARTSELAEGRASIAGGKLADKMFDAGATDEMVKLAVELRRGYANAVRTNRYMADGELDRLQDQVKSEMMTLRTRFVAGEIDTDGVGFLALCLERLDNIVATSSSMPGDRAAFLKGCMYDITDRCLHRFARPEQ